MNRVFHKNDTDMTCGILRRIESLWLSRDYIDITIMIQIIVKRKSHYILIHLILVCIQICFQRYTIMITMYLKKYTLI